VNDETLTALRGSIAKWEAIVAGHGSDEGDRNCPLCQLFFKNPGCVGCPVAEATGLSACSGSPYEDVHLGWGETINAISNAGDREDVRAQGQAELDFLRSLLPTAEDAA